MKDISHPLPEVTPFELDTAIGLQSCKKLYSAREDGLTIDILLVGYDSLKPYLLNLMNSCMIKRHFPSQWKVASITVLLKPGKADYLEGKSYRPISILSALGKILEKIIQNRLLWQARHCSWISKSQHGFLEGRSTETASITLVNTIKQNF